MGMVGQERERVGHQVRGRVFITCGGRAFVAIIPLT